jgi:hypothetical protein
MVYDTKHLVGLIISPCEGTIDDASSKEAKEKIIGSTQTGFGFAKYIRGWGRNKQWRWN